MRVAIATVSLLALAAPGVAAPQPDADDGGITLPDGFGAVVVHEGVGRARHIAVRDNGDIYVALMRPNNEKGAVALRDEDGDGKADRVEYFSDEAGTGIAIHNGHLYFGANNTIYRWALPEGDGLAPQGEPEVVVSGFRQVRQHWAKPITFDADGWLYTNMGADSNACQVQSRTPGSPGEQPCSHLEYAGNWRFRADQLNQTFPDDGELFTTGVRHCVALEWNDEVGMLYAVQHGRDQLSSLFPDAYTADESAELPAEEFHMLPRGANLGWPYTYWNHIIGARMLAPEYGGDGSTVDRGGTYRDPILGFPGHWAPNDLLFYSGDQFPARYRNGAFVAFHGSWNRAPRPQAGYNVCFVPFNGASPSGDYEVFADGFTGKESIRSPREAEHRPMGLAVGPDGSLYITDSTQGTIWRVMHTGD